MAYANMFNNSEKELSGKVVVTLHQNPIKQGTYYGRVVRNVADDAAIATGMTKYTDVIKFIDIAPVMSAFVSEVKDELSRGNAVKISGLGTFYLRIPGAISTSTPTVADLGRLAIGFAADVKLPLTVKDTEVSAIVEKETMPEFGEVTDMDTMMSGSITSGKYVRIKGKYLAVAGEASEKCGVYVAPVASDGSYKADQSDWIRCDDADIRTNTATQVMVRMPALTSGSYKLAIKTRSPANGCKFAYDSTKANPWVPADPSCLLKTPRLGITETAFLV